MLLSALARTVAPAPLALARAAGARGVLTRAEFKTQQDYIDLEAKHGAHNYAPLPVVLARGRGVSVWDTDGKEYLDFLSAYSAVNQGHCHPKIVQALVDQARELTLTSRAFHNKQLAAYIDMMTKLFGYDRLLPANTGVEAGEAALKVARKWAYEVKGVAANQAKVIYAEGNFWGRSIAAVSSSTDANAYTNFGPFVPGLPIVPYDDIAALEAELRDPTVAAFYVEPIQGEAGVRVPTKGYLSQVAALCRKHNVLFIADEIQTGLGRTGKLVATEHDDNAKPDVLVLGKALSGGLLPVSAILASDEVLGVLQPGQHGSTYGGNPLACEVAMTAIEVLLEEDMIGNSERMGTRFRSQCRDAFGAYPWVSDIRGHGLMNAIEIDPHHPVSADQICKDMLKNGLLAKPTHQNIIRFAPPLVIDSDTLDKGCEIIAGAFERANR